MSTSKSSPFANAAADTSLIEVGQVADNSAEPDQVGAVSATSVESDAEFVSPVEIGGQKIVVTFDTGSADL